jgi:DNA-binding transcriptional MerR regulator
METFTIKDAARMMNVPASTIRFYDKEGLLPFVHRSEAGYRIFCKEDIANLRIIDCLKRTGMPIKDIRQFCIWHQAGDSTLEQRYALFLERKKAVEKQIAELQAVLQVIDHKCEYYRTSIEAGTESIHTKDEIPWDVLSCEMK